jgi:hypothetical protein
MSENETKAILSLKDEVSENLKKIDSNFEDLFKKIDVGTIAGALGVAELTREIIKMTQEAGEAQTTNNELIRVTEQVGTKAGWTATQVTALAESISKKTGVETDNLKSIANMVLVHENLSGSVFPKVMQAITDLAFVQGKGVLDANSLSAAQHILAGAMERPETAARMLRNSVVPLSDAAKEAIKQAMAHGDAEKARGIILEDVQKHVKGAAEGMGTYARANNDLTTATKELAQTVGGIFLPAWITLKEVFAAVATSVQGMIIIFRSLGQAQTDLVQLNFKNMGKYRKDIDDAAKLTVAAWKNMSQNIKAELAAQNNAHVDAAKKNVSAERNQTKMTQEEIDARMAAAEIAYQQAKAKSDAHYAAEEAAFRNMCEREKEADKDRRTTLDNLSQMSSAKDIKLREVAKAASVVQVGVKASEGAMDAYTAMAMIPIIGPGLGAVAAGLLLAFGAEQIATITGLTYPAAARGAYVPGSPYGTPIVVGDQNRPEYVLNENHLNKIARKIGGNQGGNQTTNLVINKSTLQTWSVQTQMQQVRLQREGRIFNNA